MKRLWVIFLGGFLKMSFTCIICSSLGPSKKNGKKLIKFIILIIAGQKVNIILLEVSVNNFILPKNVINL